MSEHAGGDRHGVNRGGYHLRDARDPGILRRSHGRGPAGYGAVGCARSVPRREAVCSQNHLERGEGEGWSHGSLRAARAVLREGADIIVAQGTEAGGHGGGRSTLPLVPAVVDMVASSQRNVPVVAAGGITDGRGLAAALMLGADGVMMGTRFSVASESLASPGIKARMVEASGDDT